jgi:hypothetical protein
MNGIFRLKQWAFGLVIFLVIAACDVVSGVMPKDEDGDYQIARKFWSTDLTSPNQSRYELTAMLRATGSHCLVYEEESSHIDQARIQSLADIFDNDIYECVKENFGSPTSGKVILLLLNIRDGYVSNGPFTAGFFFPKDLQRGETSNRCKMLYIDTYPSFDNISLVRSTMAHEFQHLINYSIRLTRDDRSMDTWIDEGLSTAAEYIYSQDHLHSRIDYFNEGANSIPNGNNFYIWGNHNDTLADYASAYMFFQWLRIHSNDGIAIYKDIINSEYTDYRAVLYAAMTHIPTLGLSGESENIEEDWATLLGSWLLANAINDPLGLYGYNGEIRPIVYSPNHVVTELFPGEATYSIAGDSAPGNAGKIRYIGVKGGAPCFNDYELASGDTIIAYNANIDEDGLGESVETGAALLPVSLRDAMLPLSQRRSAKSAQEGETPTQGKSYAVDAKTFLEGHAWK